ncbi:MAG: PAS-domain containing protein [Thalassobaculaceae bacterium]
MVLQRTDPLSFVLLISIIIISVMFGAGAAGIHIVDIIRSYGNGTAHYSKGHLKAVKALDRLARTGEWQHFAEYQREIHKPRSVGVARDILEDSELPIGNSYPFLIQGKNHPDDVAGIAWLYRTFNNTPIFAEARETWREADERIAKIDALAQLLSRSISEDPTDIDTRSSLIGQIQAISAEVLHLEDKFMYQLGTHARVLKRYALSGLALLGLLLALLIWRLGIAARLRLASAERAIRDHEKRLEDIVEVAADWVWETDENHRFTFISSRLEQVAGVSTGVFLGQRRRENAATIDTEGWRAHEIDLAERRAFRDFEYVFRLPNGAERHFRINGKPLFNESGDFIGYRGTGSDISEAVEAREEARVKQGLLEATFQHMAQGISVVDANLIAVAFNRRFLDLLDFPPERFAQGDPFEAFVRFNAERGEYGAGDLDALVADRVAQAAKFEPHDFERVRPDGTVIEVCGRPLPTGGFVTTYTDVTDRKRALEDLRTATARAMAANHAKSMFLANMSHELRTPLNAIIGFSDLLVQKRFGPLDARYADYANYINESGQHLLAVISDILDLAKIDTGQVNVLPVAVSPHAVTEACFRILRERAALSNVTLLNELPSDAPSIFADERLLRQILINLIGNSIKFSDAGGVVKVKYTQTADRLSGLTVIDNGIGMNQNQIAQALEPFSQLNTGHTRVYEGVGLGLSLVHRYTELQGGRLEIVSEENAGTQVTVIFPNLNK